MKTPGFWIGKIQAPDRILLTGEQIRAFNARVREKLGLTRDPASLDDGFSGRKLRKDLNYWLDLGLGSSKGSFLERQVSVHLAVP